MFSYSVSGNLVQARYYVFNSFGRLVHVLKQNQRIRVNQSKDKVIEDLLQLLQHKAKTL